MYITPSSGHTSFNFNMPFKLILSSCELFSNVWSENTALFERLMEIHLNSPKLYYGFNQAMYSGNANICSEILWIVSYQN